MKIGQVAPLMESVPPRGMMMLTQIEPEGRRHERRSYECRECGQAESYTLAIGE